MASKKIKICILLLWIVFFQACSSSNIRVKPDDGKRQIRKVYKKKIVKDKINKPILEEQKPVLLLRDSPRVHYALSYYEGKGKPFIQDALKRKERYQDMIIEELQVQQLPEELVNVALIESRFVPTARSSSGAVGMWQFMPNTARAMGLKVGFFTDERTHPRKSTKAAVKYLKKLYGIHGDWFLAIAAYNAGSGNVKKAITNCGTTDFFKFENCSGLTEETLNFVSKFVAVTAIIRRLNYYGN